MAITKLDRSMPFWAVESGKVSDLKPPSHVLSATGCVVVAKLQHDEGTTAGPLESSMAARVLSRLADSTPTEGKMQGYRSHVAGCPMRAEKLEPQIRFTVWKALGTLSRCSLVGLTHQRQSNIDVDGGQTSWLYPSVRIFDMIDGGPNSEYEPNRVDWTRYCYLHASRYYSPRPGCRLQQYSFSRANQSPRVARGLKTVPGVMA